MNKIITAGYVALAATAALAMPNRQDLAKAKPLVEAQTKADLAAYKAGEKTAQKVAAAHIAYAQRAEGEAAKYLLYQGAFKLYARSGEYDLAADTIVAMNRNVKDIPPEVIAEIIGDELRYVSDDKAPRLVALLKEAKGAASTGDEQSDIVKKCLKINETESNKTIRNSKVIATLFPGWTLDTEVLPNGEAGFIASHRGQDNVVCVHPWNPRPAILSRTVTLSNKNPCLFLNVSSWDRDTDYLLKVRVDGKDAFPDRLICTTDISPWEELVVPLSPWRGRTVKIELVDTPVNRFWGENLMLSRLEIAEGNGDMRIVEGKATIDGYTWSYRAQNGEATIVAETNGQFSCAVSPCPIGKLVIPSKLGGAKVTRIGREAFADCCGITSVAIPAGVMQIGRRAFFNCNGIKSVDLPSTVKNLEWDAFCYCTALTTIVLPMGVENIDHGVFNHCRGLTSITIPSSVRYIGMDVFDGCGSLTSVSIPTGITGIDCGTFRGCTALTAVTIPASVRHIGRDAFNGCGSLTAVAIPSGVTGIDWAAFLGCTALTSVTIPASVTNIDKTAFCNTGALNAFSVEDGNRFYKSANGLLLTKDGTRLVHGVNGDVKIPSSVTAIGPCAFEGCVPLRSVVIPSGVKSIDLAAFKQCRWLTSVTIPKSVTCLGGEAFNMCGALTSVTILGERPVAPDNVFANCGKLKEIHVPANAKSWAGMKEWLGKPLVFDAKADAGAPAKDVKWNYEVKDGEIVLGGNGRTAVPIATKGLLVIPDTIDGVKVTSIGENAFSRCKGLTAVTIPEGVTTIAKGAFGWCENLKSVTLPPTVKKIENCAFYFCGELESLTIPPSVTYIGEDVFHRCSGLKSIVIPEGVTFIGRDTLMGCSGLETLTIPANVARIDFHAFRECSGLMSLTFRGERPVCGNAIFEACPKLTEIHVPANAKSWAGMKEWQGKKLVFDVKE